MAELADALDSKSSSVHPECGFESHLRHLSSRRAASAARRVFVFGVSAMRLIACLIGACLVMGLVGCGLPATPVSPATRPVASAAAVVQPMAAAEPQPNAIEPQFRRAGSTGHPRLDPTTIGRWNRPYGTTELEPQSDILGEAAGDGGESAEAQTAEAGKHRDQFCRIHKPTGEQHRRRWPSLGQRLHAQGWSLGEGPLAKELT